MRPANFRVRAQRLVLLLAIVVVGAFAPLLVSWAQQEAAPEATESKQLGRHIGRVSRAAPTGDITYTKQVSRIMQRRCVECHRAGGIAPFALDSYQTVAAWAETICGLVGAGNGLLATHESANRRSAQGNQDGKVQVV